MSPFRKKPKPSKYAPHTHAPELYYSYGTDTWKVRYGDTNVGMSVEPPTPEELERAIREVVEKHDKGTIEAGIREGKLDAIKNQLSEKQGEWGVDILGG